MTSPDQPRPDKAQVGASAPGWYQTADPDTLGAAENSWLTEALEGVRNSVLGMLGGFVSVAAAIQSGITGIVEAITGITGGGLFDLENWASNVRDGQLDLNGRVDLLSPLQEYGSCYAAGQGDLINTGRVPFNRQIGPMTGCHLWPEMNAIVLDSPGLWDIRARLGFSWTIGGNAVRWHIRVVSPQGTIFHQTFDRSAMSAVNHREINTSVVVPSVGYFVEVWIDALEIGRATLGGPENNRLTVQHITRDTRHQIGG